MQAMGVGLNCPPDDVSTAASASHRSGSALDSVGWRGVLSQGLQDELGPAVATGLSNEAGEYNCFLNVIIQCLWHCADFRQQASAWWA